MSLREPTTHRPGGKRGRKGEALRPVAEPDAVVGHHPLACSGCGEALTGEMGKGEAIARHVFDLPEPRPVEVTEHRARSWRYVHRSSVTQAAFPKGINSPVQ
jgi:transposase